MFNILKLNLGFVNRGAPARHFTLKRLNKLFGFLHIYNVFCSDLGVSR